MDVGITQLKGKEAEDRACSFLQDRGMTLVQRNYRLAGGPRRRGGEIDLILRDGDGTLVFVEVRQRSSGTHGSAAASVGWIKRQRLQRAAAHYLLRWPQLPACRFDVVALEGDRLEWHQAAFDLGA